MIDQETLNAIGEAVDAKQSILSRRLHDLEARLAQSPGARPADGHASPIPVTSFDAFQIAQALSSKLDVQTATIAEALRVQAQYLADAHRMISELHGSLTTDSVPEPPEEPERAPEPTEQAVKTGAPQKGRKR